MTNYKCPECGGITTTPTSVETYCIFCERIVQLEWQKVGKEG